MVEHDAADGGRFGGSAVASGVEQNFFLGADDAGGAIELVHHHTAAADGVEFEVSHPGGDSGVLERPWRSGPRLHPGALPFGLEGGASAAANLVEAADKL